jgi:predicted small secreted protein
MKKIALIALVVLQATALSACNVNVNGGHKAVNATSASAEERQQVDAASQRILALLDSGQYMSAWDFAAPRIKNGGKRDVFVKELQFSRKAVKNWRTRALIKTVFHDALPSGVPSRNAAIYSEVECGKARCTEEMVLQYIDGSWLLAGYNVHKALRVPL